MESNQKKSTFESVLEQEGVLIYTNKGVSMRPLLHAGRDVMVIQRKEPDVRCKKYDTVLFKRDNGQYVLHRILQVRPTDYWIVGDNCFTGEYIREDQILGIMTSVKRNGRTIQTTDRGYLFYVHLWCDHYQIRFWLLRQKSRIRWHLSHIKHMLMKG